MADDAWNINHQKASLGQAETKKFEEKLARHLGGEQVAAAPPSLPFHMGNGDVQWDIKTRFVKFFIFLSISVLNLTIESI